jgi:glutathione S-transferase
MASTLYFTHQDDHNLKQVLVAAQFLRSDLRTQEINKKYDPLTLLTPEGSINQPVAILQFVAGAQLGGNSQMDRLRVWEWFEHFNLELHPLLRELYEQIGGIRGANKEKYDYSLKELLRELEVINSHLKLRTFLVGDTVTVADISLATHLDTAFK